MTKVRSREDVIDAAARIFAKKGYDNARLEEIAAELGIAKGGLYHYTASKADLLYLVTSRRLLTLIQRAESIAASDDSPGAKLAAVLRVHLHQLDEFYPESAQWFLTPATRHNADRHKSEIEQLNRDYVEVLSRIIAAGVDAGEFRDDVDVRIATLGLLGKFNWLTRWYRKDGRLTIDQIGDTFIPVELDGLRAPPSVPAHLNR